jgi:hypothetical protein
MWQSPARAPCARWASALALGRRQTSWPKAWRDESFLWTIGRIQPATTVRVAADLGCLEIPPPYCYRQADKDCVGNYDRGNQHEPFMRSGIATLAKAKLNQSREGTHVGDGDGIEDPLRDSNVVMSHVSGHAIGGHHYAKDNHRTAIIRFLRMWLSQLRALTKHTKQGDWICCSTKLKIPGTFESLHAIEESIFAGVPINDTLLFSVGQ